MRLGRVFVVVGRVRSVVVGCGSYGPCAIDYGRDGDGWQPRCNSIASSKSTKIKVNIKTDVHYNRV